MTAATPIPIAQSFRPLSTTAVRVIEGLNELERLAPNRAQKGWQYPEVCRQLGLNGTDLNSTGFTITNNTGRSIVAALAALERRGLVAGRQGTLQPRVLWSLTETGRARLTRIMDS